MGQNISPADLLTRIQSLEEQVRRLSAAPRMFATTQHGGTYELDNEDGSLTYFQFGAFKDNTGTDTFGIFIAGSGNPTERVLEIGPEGLSIPAQMGGSMRDVTTSEAVTAGAFTDLYDTNYYTVTADALVVTIPWTTGGGTTGEIRIHNTTAGGGTTSAISLPAASGGFATFNWLHAQPLNTGPFVPTVQARRTGGAGNVNVFQPSVCYTTKGAYVGATVTGV